MYFVKKHAGQDKRLPDLPFMYIAQCSFFPPSRFSKEMPLDVDRQPLDLASQMKSVRRALVRLNAQNEKRAQAAEETCKSAINLWHSIINRGAEKPHTASPQEQQLSAKSGQVNRTFIGFVSSPLDHDVFNVIMQAYAFTSEALKSHGIQTKAHNFNDPEVQSELDSIIKKQQPLVSKYMKLNPIRSGTKPAVG